MHMPTIKSISALSSTASFSAAAAAVHFAEQTPIDKKRSSLVGVATPEGWDLFTYLGDPIGGPENVTGGTIQRYLRGYIVERNGGGVFVLYGLAADAWSRLGGPFGFVGLPISDLRIIANSGTWVSFDNADITWSTVSGAHEIHGAIRERWHALGGVAFGYPTSDETPLIGSHGAEIGRFNSFAGGAGIYWSPSTGAWEVCGAISTQWNGVDGGPGGMLGFPLSGETDTPDPGGRYNQFERGVIVWHPNGPYAGAWSVTDLTLVLSGFQSSFDDIHVQVNVDVTDPTLASHIWIPSDSDYASDPIPGNPRILSVPVVTPSTVFNLWMDGLGEHTFGHDERLGEIQHRYDITNVWGLIGENPVHTVTQNGNGSYSFSATYAMETTSPIDARRPFRESMFWPFSNFGTPELTDADYSATYTGIPEGEEAFWHPFDRYFYNHTYKGSAAGGNCYGMVLEALYAINGQSVFGEPIFDNPFLAYPPSLTVGSRPDPSKEPDDSRFATPINIRHGYQFGAAAQDWNASSRESGLVTDPLRVFRESKALHDAGELQLITVRFGGQGHAVLPYAWEEEGSVKVIYVANPNTPWAVQNNASDRSNVIVISTSGPDTDWSLDVGGGTFWRGGTKTGGEILYMPFSLVSYRPERAGGGDIFGSSMNTATIIVGAGATFAVSEEGRASTLATAGASEWGIPGLVRLPIDSSPIRVWEAPTPGLVQLVNPLAASKSVRNAQLDRPISEVVSPHFGVVNQRGAEVYRFKRPLSMITAKEAKARVSVPASLSATAPAHSSRTLDVAVQPPTTTPTPFSPHLPVFVLPAATENAKQGLVDATQQGARGSAPQISVGGHSDPVLRWEIAATDGLNSSWALRSGSGSVIVEVSGAAATDVIQVESVLTGLPAITLFATNSEVLRNATVTLVGPTQLVGTRNRVITVSGLGLQTAGCTIQMIDDGDTLAITNAANAAECAITFTAGFDSSASTHRDAVPLPAGVVITIAPDIWSSTLPTQHLNVQHRNAADGTLIQQLQI